MLHRGEVQRFRGYRHPRRASLRRGRRVKTQPGLHRGGTDKHAFQQPHPPVTRVFVLLHVEGSPYCVRGPSRWCSQQPGFRSNRGDWGRCRNNAGLPFGRGLGKYVRHQLGGRECHEPSVLQGCLARLQVLRGGFLMPLARAVIHPSCSRWA